MGIRPGAWALRTGLRSRVEVGNGFLDGLIIEVLDYRSVGDGLNGAVGKEVRGNGVVVEEYRVCFWVRGRGGRVTTGWEVW